MIVFAILPFMALILSFEPGIVLFTIGALSSAVLFGLGNGAVFKLVAEYYPAKTGVVTGVVGAAGGLGGFFLRWFWGGAGRHGLLHARVHLPGNLRHRLPAGKRAVRTQAPSGTDVQTEGEGQVVTRTVNPLLRTCSTSAAGRSAPAGTPSSTRATVSGSTPTASAGSTTRSCAPPTA